MEPNLQIELKNICVAYPQRSVLEDFNLQVFTHDFIGIIGPNGSGKTSLLKLILGLQSPTSGSVHYYQNGKPASRIRMGYLPQYTLIDRKFPISVYEVVLSGLNREKSLFRRFTPAHHQMVYHTLCEMGLDGMEQREIGVLSGGELQRTLLARALVSNPEVLVLDEPNTYMDRNYEHKLYELLDKIRHKHTILMVSHNLNEIENLATRIYAL